MEEEKMKVLAVIDMQYDFIDGALGTQEAVQIVEHVAEKVLEYQQAGQLIVYTRDTHTEDYLNTQEGQNLPVLHCIKETKGWEIHSDVYQSEYPIIDKPSFGSFALADWIAAQNDIESIELIGLCTDICVISNAMILKAAFPELLITVDSACCAGVTPQSHQNALKAMEMCQIRIK